MKTIQTDVLVIGAGGAGLRAAIELHDAKVDVTVVGKCAKRDAHTILATGGINAALGNMDPKDSWQLHAADTIRDGGLINDPEAVSLLCKHAPSAVKELKKWGCPFHLEKNGKITQRFFGAATYRRACFVGDQTGKAILNTLVDQVVKRKIPFKEYTYIFSLLYHEGHINGAIGIDMKKGELIVFHAKKVILATGGHSRMYGRSSSRFWENNGDGIWLAYNAGCSFMDMEMFQFHPTGMVWPAIADGVLVTEAVRGEGGILTNTKGERFMEHYSPHWKELAARDVVARANYMEIQSGRGSKKGGVYLDISHKSRAYILKRLPLMYKQFKKYAKIDITKQKMEVAPTAHYSMGGIHVDHKTGKTGVENLYAIGEVSSGVHGGNRLGGNSLAEITVFGKLTGQQVAKDVKRQKKFIELDQGCIADAVDHLNSLFSSSGKNPVTVKKEIQELMWKHVGVVREEKGLKRAQRDIKKFCLCAMKVPRSLKMNEALMAALDVQNMMPTCQMIIESCLMRKESRAAHYRSDYPKLSKSWQKNIICEPTPKGLKFYTQKVGPVPASVKKMLDKKGNVSKKLLE